MTTCCHPTCCSAGGRVYALHPYLRLLQRRCLSVWRVDVRGALRRWSGTRAGLLRVRAETMFCWRVERWQMLGRRSTAVLWRPGAGRVGRAASRPALGARTKSERRSWRRAARRHSTAERRAGGQAGVYSVVGLASAVCSVQGASALWLWLLWTQVAPCSCFSCRKVKVGHNYWPLAATPFDSARLANTQRTDDVREECRRRRSSGGRPRRGAP